MFIVALIWLVGLLSFGSAKIFAWSMQGWIGILHVTGVSAALYLLPGLALLAFLWPEQTLTMPERVILAGGIGVALPPLLIELAYVLGIPWGRSATVVYIAVAIVCLLLQNARRWRSLPSWRWQRAADAHTLILVAMVVLALLMRLFLVRDLPVGLWGDAYHHTMIAQLLVDNRGLFNSWQPYAPLVTFTYHYGFHANAAFFHWLSGIDVPHSVLLVSQMQNMMALPIAYMLTTRLTGLRSAGLWAALLTGFVNTLPLYYMNWGRYTQLTGQLILATVVVCWMVALESQHWHWRAIILAGVVTACLMLTHYIVTIFAVLFLGSYVVMLVVRNPTRATMLRLGLRATAVSILALFLASPWLIRTMGGFLVRNASGFVSQSVGGERIAAASALSSTTPFFLLAPIVALAVLGCLLALARRHWEAVLLGVWSQLLVVVVVPQVLGLPGTGIVTSFTAAIALYLPAIPLAGYAIGVVQDALSARWRTVNALAIALMIAVTVWGMRWQANVLDPNAELFTPADQQAMTWIRANTVPEAVFLVNMIPAYGDTLVAGTDGGWWIPLMTGRKSTLPPITYGSERAETPDYTKRIRGFATALRQHPLPSAEGLSLVRQAGINYIYSGAHIGQPDRIDVDALRENTTFRIVYEHDGVVIFAVSPAP